MTYGAEKFIATARYRWRSLLEMGSTLILWRKLLLNWRTLLMALPACLIFISDGMSLHSSYWHLGVPFRASLSIYGMGKGAGFNFYGIWPFVGNLLFWTLLAGLTRRLWRVREGQRWLLARGVLSGILAGCWGFVWAIFLASSASPLLDWISCCLSLEGLLGLLAVCSRLQALGVLLVFILPVLVLAWMTQRFPAKFRAAIVVLPLLLLFALAYPPVVSRSSGLPFDPERGIGWRQIPVYLLYWQGTMLEESRLYSEAGSSHLWHRRDPISEAPVAAPDEPSAPAL
jgi:hypothetical protein